MQPTLISTKCRQAASMTACLRRGVPQVMAQSALDEQRAQGVECVQRCEGTLAVPPLVCNPGELLSL